MNKVYKFILDALGFGLSLFFFMLAMWFLATLIQAGGCGCRGSGWGWD